MNTKLFLVCPFSSMEGFLRKKFGSQSFFLTSMAVQSQFHYVQYFEAISNVIQQEHITGLYVVNDVSCPFINGILKGEKPFGTMAEATLQTIFIENYAVISSQANFMKRVECLAELNVKQQLEDITDNELFKSLMLHNKLAVKGLITNKQCSMIRELKPHNREF